MERNTMQHELEQLVKQLRRKWENQIRRANATKARIDAIEDGLKGGASRP